MTAYTVIKCCVLTHPPDIFWYLIFYSIVSQFQPDQTYLMKRHCNATFLSTSGSPQSSLPFTFDQSHRRFLTPTVLYVSQDTETTNIDGRHSNSLMPLLPAPVSYIGQAAAAGSTDGPNRLHARPNAVQQLQYRCNYYNSTRHALTPCYCLPAIEYLPTANIWYIFC